MTRKPKSPERDPSIEGVIRPFRRDASATAQVEYALLLGAMAGVVLLATLGLGSLGESVFRRVANAGTAGTSENRPGVNQGPAGLSPPGEQAADRTGDALRWAALSVCVLGLAAIGWWMLRPRQPKTSPDAATEADTAAAPRMARFVGKRQQILRIMAGRPEVLLEGSLLVRHLMTDRLVTVSPSSTVAEMAAIMAREDVRHLLVCGSHDQLLGVISDRDLRAPVAKRAKDLMAKRPLSIGPDASIKTAVTMMLDKHISSLPVVEEDQLKGIVTTADLAMALQCAMQLLDEKVPTCSV